MRTYIRWDPPNGPLVQVRDLEEAKSIIQFKHPNAVYSEWDTNPIDASPDHRMHVWQDQQARQDKRPEVAWIILTS